MRPRTVRTREVPPAAVAALGVALALAARPASGQQPVDRARFDRARFVATVDSIAAAALKPGR